METMEPNYEARLKAERLRLGLSQKKISDVLGYTKTMISYIERGKRKVHMWELHKLYCELGMDVGIGKIFEWIDQKNSLLLEKLKISQEEFFESERRALMSRNYYEITFATLEKIKRVLYMGNSGNSTNIEESFMSTQMTEDEACRLRMILQLYIEKDGNIERALSLLDIAIKESLKD